MLYVRLKIKNSQSIIFNFTTLFIYLFLFFLFIKRKSQEAATRHGLAQNFINRLKS